MSTLKPSRADPPGVGIGVAVAVAVGVAVGVTVAVGVGDGVGVGIITSVGVGAGIGVSSDREFAAVMIAWFGEAIAALAEIKTGAVAANIPDKTIAEPVRDKERNLAIGGGTAGCCVALLLKRHGTLPEDSSDVDTRMVASKT
jgi:hypothetical protein